jgi:hypothetical protein
MRLQPCEKEMLCPSNLTCQWSNNTAGTTNSVAEDETSESTNFNCSDRSSKAATREFGFAETEEKDLRAD